MRKLILKMSLSFDGFAGGPNGEIDWLFKSMDEATTSWILDTVGQAGVHIMGSRTFEDMAAYWPYSDEPLAAPMNEIPKIVFSKSGAVSRSGHGRTTQALKDATRLQAKDSHKSNPHTPDRTDTWENATVATGDLATEIMQLKQQSGKAIVAHGGAGFVRSLVATGLIDEYQLLTHPVVLGKGLPIFSDLSEPLDLSLISTTILGSGCIAAVYRPPASQNLVK
ncbi:MAG: bifunctional deaminase-reductase-like protein [Mucilaginibacter sp.]|nr:bifunctional deaminase-reductase-like protein [Mucilaginibacter sp.]